MHARRTPPPQTQKSVALSGVAAGDCAVSVGVTTGNDLHYRGTTFSRWGEFERARESPTSLVALVLCRGCSRCIGRAGGVQGESQVAAGDSGPPSARRSRPCLPPLRPMDVLRPLPRCWGRAALEGHHTPPVRGTVRIGLIAFLRFDALIGITQQQPQRPRAFPCRPR